MQLCAYVYILIVILNCWDLDMILFGTQFFSYMI